MRQINCQIFLTAFNRKVCMDTRNEFAISKLCGNSLLSLEIGSKLTKLWNFEPASRPCYSLSQSAQPISSQFWPDGHAGCISNPVFSINIKVRLLSLAVLNSLGGNRQFVACLKPSKPYYHFASVYTSHFILITGCKKKLLFF